VSGELGLERNRTIASNPKRGNEFILRLPIEHLVMTEELDVNVLIHQETSKTRRQSLQRYTSTMQTGFDRNQYI
jgi:hypothetical protein